MEVDEIRSVLAGIRWNEQFDQPTLKRANTYLRPARRSPEEPAL